MQARDRFLRVIDDARGNICKDRHNIRVVWIRNDNPVRRHAGSGSAECGLQALQIGKVIGVVELDVGENKDLRRKFEDMVTILTRLDDEKAGVPCEKIGTAFGAGKIPHDRAHDGGRLFFRIEEYLREHTGRRRFPVCAGNGYGPRIFCNFTECFEIRQFRYPRLLCPHALDIIFRHRIGVQKKPCVGRNIALVVPDDDRDASLGEHRRHGRLLPVGPAHSFLPVLQKLGERGHSNTSNAYHVDILRHNVMSQHSRRRPAP